MLSVTERPMPTTLPLDTIFGGVKALLGPTDAFGPVEIKGGVLIASAKASAAPAFYRLEWDAGKAGVPGGLWVALVMPSRWLSESIESDLVEHGDDVGELVEDELIELGYEGEGMPPTFQHFRSNDLLYTFRTPIPIGEAGLSAPGDGGRPVDAERIAGVAALWMRAYEQAFRRLGDMEVKEA
jgi:hypothetical protein